MRFTPSAHAEIDFANLYISSLAIVLPGARVQTYPCSLSCRPRGTGRSVKWASQSFWLRSAPLLASVQRLTQLILITHDHTSYLKPPEATCVDDERHILLRWTVRGGIEEIKQLRTSLHKRRKYDRVQQVYESHWVYFCARCDAMTCMEVWA